MNRNTKPNRLSPALAQAVALGLTGALLTACGGDDAPPGFGAQFTQITPEARQLVYRYVRNREPIFHDDF